MIKLLTIFQVECVRGNTQRVSPYCMEICTPAYRRKAVGPTGSSARAQKS
jgi:hypothetical protein